MEAGGKRKRDLYSPRITYHASGRTFDRLFKEDSLKELKAVARKKLGLGSDATIHLSQIRGDKYIDLEDEDDFDAFYNALLLSSTADVRVTIEKSSITVTNSSSNNREPQQATEKKKKKRTLDNPPLSSPDNTVKQPAGANQPVNEGAEPPSKRLKIAPTKPSNQSAELAPPSKSPPNEAPKKGGASAMVAKGPMREVPQAGSALPLVSALLSAFQSPSNPGPTKNDALPVNNAKTGEPAEKVSARPAGAQNAIISSDIPVARTNLTPAEVDEPKKKKRKVKENPGSGDKKAKKLPTTQKLPTEAETIASVAASAPPVTTLGPTGAQSSSQPAKTISSLSRLDESTGHKDVNPKTKKSKLATAKEPVTQAKPSDSGKLKKKAKSKSKEREATTAVESEIKANDPVTETSLANISRLMIEKYLNPSSAVGSDQSIMVQPTRDLQVVQSTSVQPTQGARTSPKPPPKRTYWADPDSIRSRIIELQEDSTQDVGGHRASIIQDLELVLRSRRTAAAKSNPNVNNSLSEPPASIGAASKANVTSTSSIAMATSPPPRPSTSPSLNDSETSSSVVPDEPPRDDPLSPHPKRQSKSSREQILFKNPVQFIQNDDGETSVSSEKVSATIPPSKPLSLRSAAPDLSSYTDRDLEALVRGPGSPLRSTQLPSTETSEDELPSEPELDDDLNGDVPSASRRQRRRVSYSESSDEEDEDEEPPTPRIATPPMPQSERALAGSHPADHSSHKDQALQQTNGGAGSVEMDETGDEVVENYFVQDNAALRLADSEPTPAQNQDTASPGPDVPPDLPTPDQLVDKDPSRGTSHPEFEPDHVPQEVAPARVFEPDPIEAAETPQNDRRRSPIEGDDGVGPSLHEQPMRESTPKPAYVHRMRTRTQLASPPQKPSSSGSAPAIVPTTKPRPNRATALRGQQRTKANNLEMGEGQEEPKEEGTVAANKPVLKRSMAAGAKIPQQAEETNEESDPPLRRSTRTASKTATPMNPITSHAIRPPVSKRTRQISKPIAMDARDPSRSGSEPKEKAKTNKSADEMTPDQLLIPPTKSADTSAHNDQTMTQGVTTPPPSPPISLDAWATLPPTTPLPGTQSDPMVDELHSDQDPIPFLLGAEPQSQRRPPSLRAKQSLSRLEQAMQNAKEKGNGKGKQKSSPLFIPSETQDAFPYSQLHSQVPTANDWASDSEEEVRDEVMKRPSETQPSKYRRLTDFASGAVRMFTPKILRHSTLPMPTSEPAKRKDKLKELYGRMGRESGYDEESDSSAGSESEVENMSHIPKSRRAGAPVKGRTPKS